MLESNVVPEVKPTMIFPNRKGNVCTRSSQLRDALSCTQMMNALTYAHKHKKARHLCFFFVLFFVSESELHVKLLKTRNKDTRESDINITRMLEL